MPPLILNGEFYPSFTGDSHQYSGEDKQCIERTVEKLLTTATTSDRPGMLLGKIQSGKTKSFMGAIALAFDNGFDVCVVLTKGTKALAKQTYERVQNEFAFFTENDLAQAFDIMTIPPGLTGYELHQKLIFVVKKQSDNLDRLGKALFET